MNSSSSKQQAHIKRNLFKNLVAAEFDQKSICFAMGFNNQDYKRYDHYEYELTEPTEQQLEYYQSLIRSYKIPNKYIVCNFTQFIMPITDTWPDFRLLRGETRRHYSEAIDVLLYGNPLAITSGFLKATHYNYIRSLPEHSLEDLCRELSLDISEAVSGLCDAAAAKNRNSA